MSQVPTLYVYANGKTHQVPTRRVAKLIKEMRAGRGQNEIMEFVMDGYDEFLAVDGQAYCMDGMTLELLGVA
jgi:hypothetical protein